jgi:hypothetical protein
MSVMEKIKNMFQAGKDHPEQAGEQAKDAGKNVRDAFEDQADRAPGPAKQMGEQAGEQAKDAEENIRDAFKNP